MRGGRFGGQDFLSQDLLLATPVEGQRIAPPLGDQHDAIV